MERSTFLYIDSNKSYPLDYSLDQVEKLIDMEKFFRVNRNYIIHIAFIKDIIAYSSSRLRIILKDWSGKDEILVSRERVRDFKAWMDR